MKEEDKELEILKAKRLAEMEKNLAQQNNQEEKETVLSNSDQNKLLPREQIIQKLGYRGLEVLSNAESQFPNETKLVEEKLAELIQSGEIDEVLDGLHCSTLDQKTLSKQITMLDGVKEFPSRIQCAALPWATTRKAITEHATRPE